MSSWFRTRWPRMRRRFDTRSLAAPSTHLFDLDLDTQDRETAWIRLPFLLTGLLLWSLGLLGTGGAQAETPPVVPPFTPDDEMVAWAHRVAPPRLAPSIRLKRWTQALLDPNQFGLREISQPTLDAREAFHQRRANCVSLAGLLVGLARHEGIPVIFLRVGPTLSSGRHGDISVTEGHLAAAWMDAHHPKIFDFAGVSDLPERATEPVTDLTAMALFESNRGVEAMLTGGLEEARQHLETAVQLDPALGEAWINLGVVRRRTGDLRGAREAYEVALGLDPAADAAYRNLAALLRSRGRLHEAEDLLEDSRRLLGEDALGFLRRAHRSFEAGEFEAARGFYRKALELSSQPTGAAPLTASTNPTTGRGHRVRGGPPPRPNRE